MSISSPCGTSSTVDPVIAVPSYSSVDAQTNCPVAWADSTDSDISITSSPLEWPSNAEIFTISSVNHVDPETLPRIPVTGFSSLESSFSSVRISVIL